MSVAIYTITRDRLPYTKKSFKLLRSRAGIEFDHFVFDNGSKDGTQEWLSERENITRLHLGEENYGQNIGANVLLDWIDEGDYEWIVRWDNDMIPRDRRFLKKLISCAQKLKEQGVEPVVAPYINKLIHQIPSVIEAEGEDVGFRYDVVALLGGMCRVHHRDFFREDDGTPWRYNQFGALGFGEANETAWRVDKMQEDGKTAMLARIPWIWVEHYKSTDGQTKDYPEYFSFQQKGVAHYVSYGL